MAKRTHYRNGDPISLPCGCDDCTPGMINGVLCHELGCKESWRDHTVACFQCGCDFYPSERYQSVCPDCIDDQENPVFPDGDEEDPD